MTAVGAEKLNRMVMNTFDGEHCFTNPYKVLRYVSEGTAERRLPGFPHTIWELLNHMNYWQTLLLQAVTEDTVHWPKHEETESWVDQDILSATSDWLEEKCRFYDGLQDAERLMMQPTALLNPLAAWPGHDGFDALHSAALHNAYHIGQIVQLCKAAGEWTPPDSVLMWQR